MTVSEIQKLREELRHLSKDNTALTGIILFAIGVAILATFCHLFRVQELVG